MDSQLSVVINSPTHTPHKFTLDLSRQCTILELKEIIVTRLDTKLTVSDQRLIFGGRILDDKDTLDRVFEKVDCSSISPTIHLVVSHRHEPGHTQQQTPLHTTTTPTSPAPIRFRGNSDNSSSAASTNTNTAATSGTDLNNFAFTQFTTATPAAATATGARDGRTETGASNSTTNTTTAYNPFPFMATAGGVPVMVPMAPQAMQYVLVNGMPYLVPAVYLPMLHYQQMQQTYGQFQFLPDGAPFLPHQNINSINSNINNPIVDQARAGAAVAAEAPQQNAQEIAARDQRRAASLWLLMKLAFGIYLFGQNGSIERLVLLHIVALVIFLHQTGRLRIVRRIVQNPPAEDAAQGAANPVPGAAAAPQPTQTTTSTSTTTTTTTSTSTSGPANSSASTANSSSNGGTNTQYATTSTSESSTTQQQQQQGGNAQAQETVTATTEAAQPQVSPWRSLEHALLTFVTSLVPAPQPDIDPAVAAAAAAGDRGM
ncbi:hypothetical protein EC957_007748 [Mortierella hygrophila]|uniref:Ubiquitin-like domain-containing protein n=1 Tax=Mortierella hygrophila TaxID=979708 RepID=A0A9P6K5W7_9FUNG|nr:hypothetical protein EC957_007748 [Mortierella hygrophila]